MPLMMMLIDLESIKLNKKSQHHQASPWKKCECDVMQSRAIDSMALHAKPILYPVGIYCAEAVKGLPHERLIEAVRALVATILYP